MEYDPQLNIYYQMNQDSLGKTTLGNQIYMICISATYNIVKKNVLGKSI